MKEIWSKGKNGGCVVSNTKQDRASYTEADYDSEMQYFGGYIVAESIVDDEKCNLIAAAPNLFDACLSAKAIYEAQGITKESRIGGEQYIALLEAIKKATGNV